MKRRIVFIIVCAWMLVCLTGCKVNDSFKQGFQDGMNSVNEETNEDNVDDAVQGE